MTICGYSALACTREGGLYYTDDDIFNSTPTWTLVSDVIAGMVAVAYDLADPNGLQLAHDGTEVYLRRSTDPTSVVNWSKVLTNIDLIFATGNGNPTVSCVAVDSVNKRLFVGVETPLTAGRQFVFRSSDYGVTWSSVEFNFGTQNRGWGGMAVDRVNGTRVVITGTSGITSKTGVWYSTNSGAAFSTNFALKESSGYKAWMYAHPTNALIWYSGGHEPGVGNTLEAIRSTDGGVEWGTRDQFGNLVSYFEIDGDLQAGPTYAPSQGGMWISADDPNYIYSHQDTDLFWGDDGSISNSQALGITPSGIDGYLDGSTVRLLIGRFSNSEVDPPQVYVTSDNGITLTDITENIPTAGGGIARQGVALTLITSVESVSISPTYARRGVATTFTATISPTNASDPTYTWSPTPTSGQGTATAVYTFNSIGAQAVAVTVANGCSTASKTQTVCVCGTLRELVYSLLSGDAGVTALVSDRIYPDRVKENTSYPCVVYHAPITDSDTAFRTRDGSTERAVATVQIDCYGQRASGVAGGNRAEDVALAVVELFNGNSGACCCFGHSFVQNRIAERQDALNEYRQIIDVLIDYRRIT